MSLDSSDLGGTSLLGHILIVDDIKDNREILSRRLRRRNYETTEVKDGYEAIDILTKQRFDLVLLDVMMPGLSGLDVLRTIRSSPATSSLPVVMITANALNENVAEARALGASDFVTKPVNFAVALACIEMQLDLVRKSAASKDGRPSLRLEQDELVGA